MRETEAYTPEQIERRRAARRRWYWKNHERMLEYQRQTRAQRAPYERDPIKRKAKQTVNLALRMGRLTKPDQCEDCSGTHALICGHHEDYLRPLVIVWLCPPCHGKRHRKTGP